MFSSISSKSLAFAMLTLFALSAGIAAAADTTATENAKRRSDQVDRDLQISADQFNREFQQSNRQIHEAEKLGQPSSAGNMYGSSADIEREIDATVEKTNKELRRAANRDNYLETRRELETNRSLYYPGSEGYKQHSEEINKLDREYADGALDIL